MSRSKKSEKQTDLNSFLQEMGFGDITLPPVTKNLDDSSSESSGSGLSDASGETWSDLDSVSAPPPSVRSYVSDDVSDTSSVSSDVSDVSENIPTPLNKRMTTTNTTTTTTTTWMKKLRERGDTESLAIVKRRGVEWIVRMMVCALMFYYIQNPTYGTVMWYLLMSGCITGIIFILYNWYHQIIVENAFEVNAAVAIDAVWLLLFGNMLRLFLRDFTKPTDFAALKCDPFYRYLHVVVGMVIFVHLLIFIITVLTFVPATRSGAAQTLKTLDTII